MAWRKSTKCSQQHTVFILDSMTKIMMRLKRQTTNDMDYVKSGVHIFSQCNALWRGWTTGFSVRFFFFRSFFVRHTHKYITPNNKKSYENKNWECEKKSLPHSFAYRYKNICRLMIILPKFIGPQHCAAFTKI